MRVFLSLKLSVLSCPHGYSHTRGDSFASRDTENKGVTSFFFKPAPVGASEQLLLELCLDSVYVFILYLQCGG